MSAYVLCGDMLYGVTKAGDDLILKKLHDVPLGVESLACAGGDLLYIIGRDNPTKLYSWRLDSGSVTDIVTMPSSLNKVIFHHNKIYCAAFQTGELFIYDPLCHETEMIWLRIPIADIVAADHGFVLEGVDGTLHGFHFNDGLHNVSGGFNATLLGSHRHYAVSFIPSRGGIAGVTELGNVSTGPNLKINGYFAILGEEFVHVDNGSGALVSSSGAMCSLPDDVAGEITLLSVPSLVSDDCCPLCFCEFDGGDGITLDCGHYFHLECVEGWVSRWDNFAVKGEHIVFTNAVCPGGCKHLLRHPRIPQSGRIDKLYRTVQGVKKEALREMEPTKTEDDVLCYLCNRCHNPFYGGGKVCSRMLVSEPTNNVDELLCDACQRDFVCPLHHRDYVVYKCRYCCNPATQRSFGTRYLCERCHAVWDKVEPPMAPCVGSNQCPLSGSHQEGSYPIGCLLCLPEQSIKADLIVQPPLSREDT